jgi:hypothetical protein
MNEDAICALLSRVVAVRVEPLAAAIDRRAGDLEAGSGLAELAAALTAALRRPDAAAEALEAAKTLLGYFVRI